AVREEHQIAVLPTEVHQARIGQQPLPQIAYIELYGVHDSVHVALCARQSQIRVARETLPRIKEVDRVPAVLRVDIDHSLILWSVRGIEGSVQVAVAGQLLE